MIITDRQRRILNNMFRYAKDYSKVFMVKASPIEGYVYAKVIATANNFEAKGTYLSQDDIELLRVCFELGLRQAHSVFVNLGSRDEALAKDLACLTEPWLEVMSAVKGRV